ncbi:hypothetical protein IHC93_19855 [Photobacterium damselae subsp. damselae]|uniref:hypothetical protein n=1 Tax=Photobacterium damselae TaxID=38293 RepID=UPI001F21FD18|nr:hypothetical protein [Photobacterium damselae]UKA27180.1 hypothetical protein IHC93_19855 [Photobacterium damselae subsp. damselae]
MSGNYINVWPVAAGGNWGYVGTNTGPYEGEFYIDNGGVGNNYYGMHLDGDSYGYIKPPKLSNGMQPLNIMSYVYGRNPSDDVTVTFSDPKSAIVLGKTYASVIIDELFAICAPFNELSENGNPQFVQKNNHFSSMLLDELHQTKKAKISIGEYERPIGERFDFVITQDSYYDASTTNRKYIIGYKSSKSAIEPATILGSEIKYLYINDSIKYGADFKIYADSIQGKHSTIIYNNNPYLLGKEGVRFTDLNEESEYFVDSIRLCDDGMKVPCSVFVADEYILTVETNVDGVIGMTGGNMGSGKLLPVKLEGDIINNFGYRYSTDIAFIQFKTSDERLFTKIYLEMDGERFCAEKSTAYMFIIDKKEKFKAILEAHEGADITFPMYAPNVVFTEQPLDQEVSIGNDYTLSIGVKEYGDIKWWFRSSSSASWVVLNDEKGLSITRTATSMSDGNQYKAWVSFDGSYAFSNVSTVTLKPNFIIKPGEIDNDYFGVSVDYSFYGTVGEITPESSQWIPSGSVQLIAARHRDDGYYVFLIGNETWNGFNYITIKAVAENDEIEIDVGYTGAFDRYEGKGDSFKEWFDFMKSNIGKEISIYITEFVSSNLIIECK